MDYFFLYAQRLLAEYSDAVLESGAWAGAWAVERVRHEASLRHGNGVPDGSATAGSVCEASVGSGGGEQGPELEG